jgi:hypothetical protein
MSKIIRSRTPDQCRSHHQKITKYHGPTAEVIRFFTEDVFTLTNSNRLDHEDNQIHKKII